LPLKRIFAEIDTDQSGAIDPQEFQVGIEILNSFFKQPPIAKDQVQALFGFIDANHDGTIDHQEFLDALSVEQASSDHPSPTSDHHHHRPSKRARKDKPEQ